MEYATWDEQFDLFEFRTELHSRLILDIIFNY